jgi:hypothetical protein
VSKIELCLALDADPETLAFRDVVFLHGALDRCLGVRRRDREGHALGLALQEEHAHRGWITSRGFFMAAKIGEAVEESESAIAGGFAGDACERERGGRALSPVFGLI